MNSDRTWLTTVLFMDICSYSLIPINDQLKVKRHFLDLVSGQINQLEEDDTIRLDTGDGMAICYLGDPERMYSIARALRAGFSSLQSGGEYQYKVRMGMNLGPVKIIEDLNNKRNCIGSGINDAERIMSFAGENQLFVSKSYFDIVSKMSQDYSNELRHSGSRADKHNQEHEIYELAVDLVPVGVASGNSNTGSTGIDNVGSAAKFDPDVIDRITRQLNKHIRKDDIDRVMQASLPRANTLGELCNMLLEAIPSEDDRYDFDQYLKSYGYGGYGK